MSLVPCTVVHMEDAYFKHWQEHCCLNTEHAGRGHAVVLLGYKLLMATYELLMAQMAVERCAP